MNGLDLIEALNMVEDCYVEEAEREPRERRRMWSAFVKAAAICAACVGAFAVPAVAKDYFSPLRGDEFAFERVEYLGDGRFSIRVRNESGKAICFQEDVKLCTFYGNREFEKLPGGSVHMEGNTVEAHSSGELFVDLSEAYAIAELQPLEDDWYYLVLTNDRFLFGQDWHCAVSFEEGGESAAESKKAEAESAVETATPAQKQAMEEVTASDFIFTDWGIPLEKMKVSGTFGPRENGSVSDHINLSGKEGESVYAVESGEVKQTGFDRELGNYVTLILPGGVEVTYGHLKECSVKEGEEVRKGEVIGSLGKTGAATGANLSLTVCVDGKAVNPLR